MTKRSADAIGLPPRPFLYTMDQISVMLDVSVKLIMDKYIYFQGRSIGPRQPDALQAIDITPRESGLAPEWRVSDREFVRWMKAKGYRYYERGY